MKNVSQDFRQTYETEGVKCCGWISYWKVGNFEMTHQSFVNVLKKYKLSEKLAPAMRNRNAVIRAIQDFSSEQAKLKGQKQDQTFYKNVKDDEVEAVWMVLNLEVDQDAHDVELGRKIRVAFNKKDHTVKVDGSPKIQKQINDLYEAKKLAFTEDQFRSFVKRYVEREGKAVGIREEGGVYFVPHTQKEEMEVLQKIFEQLPSDADCALVEIPIPDVSKARSGVWQSMTAEVSKELELLTKNFEDNKDEMTEKMIQNRLADYTQLRGRIDVYELVLRDTADGLKQKLRKLEDAIKKKAGL